MIVTVPFKVEHFYSMELDPHFLKVASVMDLGRLIALQKSPHSYTVMKGERVIACGGVVEIWPDRAIAWTFFAKCDRHEFLIAFRVVKRFLDMCSIKRIEADIENGFDQAHRWIKLLGFKLEAASRPNYTPDGRDYALYARVK